MEMGGVIVRRKVPKSTQNIFNNQQRLVCEMEGSGGRREWEKMTTDDDGGCIVT